MLIKGGPAVLQFSLVGTQMEEVSLTSLTWKKYHPPPRPKNKNWDFEENVRDYFLGERSGFLGQRVEFQRETLMIRDKEKLTPIQSPISHIPILHHPHQVWGLQSPVRCGKFLQNPGADAAGVA